MKVKVKDKYLNIRAGKPSLNAACYQNLAPGSEIEVDGKLYKGDLYDGTDLWLKDQGDNYYWLGGVEHDISESAISKFNGTEDKITFDWSKFLHVDEIWNKYKVLGSGAKVAIIDTGYSHSNQDIAPKINAVNAINFVRQIDYPNLPLTTDDRDVERHGTKCAGLVGSLNKGKWNAGIAPQCELLIARVSYDGSLPNFQYIFDAIEWAVGLRADVISISLYQNLNTEEISIYQKKLDGIVAGKNVLIFAAAGNSANTPIIKDFYPSAFKGVISVGASTLKGELSLITALSSKTVLHAPGEKIECYNAQNIPSPASGTSFSTPIIAGIAALAIGYLKARDKGWNSESLKQKMLATADLINSNTNKKIINPINLFKNI